MLGGSAKVVNPRARAVLLTAVYRNGGLMLGPLTVYRSRSDDLVRPGVYFTVYLFYRFSVISYCFNPKMNKHPGVKGTPARGGKLPSPTGGYPVVSNSFGCARGVVMLYHASL